MELEEKIKAIQAWQENKYLHPLTCGADRCSGVLFPVEEREEIILKCPECKYNQRYIPEFIYEAKKDGFHESMKDISKDLWHIKG